MPRVGHLAIAAKDHRKLARFYGTALHLRTVYENESAAALSDGAVDLVLLLVTAGGRQGIDHIGFNVEEADTIRRRLQYGVTAVTCGTDAEGRPYPEFRTADPDGNAIQFSGRVPSASEKKSPLPIRHIALYTPDPQRLADFYTSVFTMKRVSSTDRASIFVSDGRINLALLSERPEEHLGLHHFGFHVPSIEEAQQRVLRAGVGAGERRPSRIPYAEYRIEDPEGNGFDISEKGWEV